MECGASKSESRQSDIGAESSSSCFHLKSVEGAVILDQEVFLLADGEVVTKLAQQVGEVDSLYCYNHGPMRAQC